MIKKIIIILTSLLILGTALTGIGYFMGGREPETTGSVLTSETKVDQFNKIVVDVIDADVKIQHGDTFSISYRLHHMEKVEQAEVVDGTLYFVTEIERRIGWHHRPHTEQHVITITVPDELALDSLNISTVDGDIEIDDRAIRSASLKSVSGDIELSGITADEVTCEVVSGEISVRKSNITEVTAEGKSADISFDGSLEYADINTVSGDCRLSSDKIKNIKIKNVSGDIEVITPAAGISAKSYGKINYCGENQGYQFNLPGNNAMMTLNSSSGKINIQTNSPENSPE